jgi:uncharacterized membrane protein
MNPRRFFHLLSYLQYPLILLGGYYALKPYWNGFEIDLDDINLMLVFMGLSVSFSTLQDPTKTQNKLSKKVWESPKKGKIFIGYLTLAIIAMIGSGIYGMINTQDSRLKEISFGLIVLGIGMISLLKTSIDMFEHHRKNKKSLPDD